MSTHVFGIRNCDTLKKALRWLDLHQIPYHFHDYRRDGLTQAQLEQWCTRLGWEALLNRRGTTFRALPAADKEHLDRDHAIQLMLAQPALIKRPLLEHEGQLHLGFSEPQYHALFAIPR